MRRLKTAWKFRNGYIVTFTGYGDETYRFLHDTELVMIDKDDFYMIMACSVSQRIRAYHSALPALKEAF